MLLQKVIAVRRLIAVIALVVLGGCISIQGSDQNCSLERPPKESGVNVVHGIYLFVFPRQIDNGYSGCQIAWSETGDKWYVLHLKDGSPVRLEINIPNARAERATCEYRNAALTAGDSSLCPDFKALIERRGLPVIPSRFEPVVPLERDLRRQ